MSNVLLFLSLLCLLGLTIRCECQCATGQCNSYKPEFESIKRFPHFVTITRDAYSSYNCSGSIIDHQWVLTALDCVRYGRFSIHFLLENVHNTRHSFSISLDDTAVFPYPTGYDNIALVKLPVYLEFSELLRPISYYAWDEDYHKKYNGFAVMPGFNLQQSSTLTHRMYKVLCRQECKTNFGSQYDEFLELCSTDWNRNYQLTLSGSAGSGLIQGWPRDPRLIGIFSNSVYGNWKSGQVFIKLSKYRHWMDEVMMGSGAATSYPDAVTTWNYITSTGPPLPLGEFTYPPTPPAQESKTPFSPPTVPPTPPQAENETISASPPAPTLPPTPPLATGENIPTTSTFITPPPSPPYAFRNKI